MKRKNFFYGILLICFSAVYAEEPAAEPEKNEKAEETIEIPAVAESSEQKCRVGMVTVAEISTVKPEIKNWSQWEEKLENHVWAELCINLFPYRGISRFDFKLAGKYHCIAVAKDKEVYSGDKDSWVIAASKDKDKTIAVRLLFAIPQEDVKDVEGTKSCTLDLNLIEAKYPSDTIAFRILPMNQPFSSVSGE